MSFSKVDHATAVVVPGEFEVMLCAQPPVLRERCLLTAVWQIGYEFSRSLRVVWCVPNDKQRLASIHAWRQERVTNDASFVLRRYPGDDFYPLVGAEVIAARRESDLTIIWSHSALLCADITRQSRELSPVVLTGIRAGVHRVSQLGGDVAEMHRSAPRHFRNPPRAVRGVRWWAP